MPIQLIADANPGTASWSTSNATSVIAATGQMTIAIGSASQTVAITPASLDGSLVLLSVETATGLVDTTLTSIVYEWNGSGSLTVTGNANATLPVIVTYAVLQTLS